MKRHEHFNFFEDGLSKQFIQKKSAKDLFSTSSYLNHRSGFMTSYDLWIEDGEELTISGVDLFGC